MEIIIGVGIPLLLALGLLVGLQLAVRKYKDWMAVDDLALSYSILLRKQRRVKRR